MFSPLLSSLDHVCLSLFWLPQFCSLERVLYQKHDGKILPDVLGDSPQKVVVGLVDTQSPLLLKLELEVEKKRSQREGT